MGNIEMKVIEIPYEKLAHCYKMAVKDGYNWGCQCGESYQTKDGAKNCKRCRTYLEFPPTQIYHTTYKED